MAKFKILSVVLVALGIASCGADDDDDNGGTPQKTLLAMSGVVKSHLLNAKAAADTGHPIDFTQLGISVVSPEDLTADPDAQPRAQGLLDTTAAGCADGSGCPFRFDEVSIEGVNLGLATAVADLRTTEKKWAQTGAGAGKIAELQAAANGSGERTGIEAFAVTLEAVEHVVSPLVEMDAATLLANGFVLGTVVDDSGEPVSGVTVTNTKEGDGITLYYPNDDLDGVQSTTASEGLFLAVSSKAETVVSFWDVAGHASIDWPMSLAGTSPGSVYVFVLDPE